LRQGFTLLEVVVALLLLEVGVIGALGMLTLSSRALGRAERLERAVAEAEGVLDSLAGSIPSDDGARAYDGGELRWSLLSGGEIHLVAVGPSGDTLLEVGSVLPPT